jgi:two-component system, chemotaxis family, response regulator Rcp1
MSEILLIEDNPGDVLLTREAFKECGHEHTINAVKDGVEGLKYLKKENNFSNALTPDLILLDLNLPRKDGRELLKEIKNDDELKTIPVIILSTSKNELDVEKCYELNVNCYVTKPVELDNFIEIIRTIEKYWMQTAKLPKTIKQLI